MRPLRKARFVNSPGRAWRAPSLNSSSSTALRTTGVLPGVAVRPPAYGTEAYVQKLPRTVIEIPVHKAAVSALRHGPSAQGLEKSIHQGKTLRPGQADYTYGGHL